MRHDQYLRLLGEIDSFCSRSDYSWERWGVRVDVRGAQSPYRSHVVIEFAPGLGQANDPELVLYLRDGLLAIYPPGLPGRDDEWRAQRAAIWASDAAMLGTWVVLPEWRLRDVARVLHVADGSTWAEGLGLVEEAVHDRGQRPIRVGSVTDGRPQLVECLYVERRVDRWCACGRPILAGFDTAWNCRCEQQAAEDAACALQVWIDAHGGATLCVEDARRAGLCEDGIRQWVEGNYLRLGTIDPDGGPRVTVEEIMAGTPVFVPARLLVGDVRRAAAVAYQREEAARQGEPS